MINLLCCLLLLQLLQGPFTASNSRLRREVFNCICYALVIWTDTNRCRMLCAAAAAAVGAVYSEPLAPAQGSLCSLLCVTPFF
jgi:hypothetical protein